MKSEDPVVSAASCEEPRVLVINGEPFSDATATGITMCNLFAGFEPRQLIQVYTADFPPRFDACGEFYKLSVNHLFRDAPIPCITATLCPPEEDGKAQSARGVPQVKAKIRRAIAPFLECLSYKVGPGLFQRLQEFRPTVIYSLGGSIRQLQLALDISKRLRLPLAIHFMDDWPSTLYQSSWMFGMRARLRRLTLSTLRTSKARLAISEAMAKEYRQRYGAEFVPFMNCVPRSRIAPFDKARNAGPHRNISFFGGLHLGRGEVILALAEAIRETKRNLQIDLYCRPSDIATYKGVFKAHPTIRFQAPATPDKVHLAMQKADVLLHVESFMPEHRQYTRFSVSTKIPEYLAAGRPILAVGPAEVASIRYLEENRAGVAVTEVDRKSMATGLAQLEDPGIVTELLTNAAKLLERNHIAESERERFKRVLAEAALA